MDKIASSHLAFSVILRVPGERGTSRYYSESRFAHNTDSFQTLQILEVFLVYSFYTLRNYYFILIRSTGHAYKLGSTVISIMFTHLHDNQKYLGLHES